MHGDLARLTTCALVLWGMTDCATLRSQQRGFRLELPASLEADRARYQADIEAARDHVVAWFEKHRLPVSDTALIDTAVVFSDAGEAKRRLAAHFGLKEEQIPDGFSGTVDGRTLFLVSRELYAKTFARMYPDEPWTETTYRGLVMHELAHRAHALTAQAVFGSEEGMGPRWFFEGLGLLCAGQFEDRPALASWEQLQELVAKDSREPLDYRIYAQMIRAVAARFPVDELVKHAGKEDFLSILQLKAP